MECTGNSLSSPLEPLHILHFLWKYFLIPNSNPGTCPCVGLHTAVQVPADGSDVYFPGVLGVAWRECGVPDWGPLSSWVLSRAPPLVVHKSFNFAVPVQVHLLKEG